MSSAQLQHEQSVPGACTPVRCAGKSYSLMSAGSRDAVGMNPVIRARARVCTMCGCCTVARNRVRPNSVQMRLPGRGCASEASRAVKCAFHQQSICRCFKLACCSCLKRSLARSVRKSQRPRQPRAHQCASRDVRCATCYQSLSPCLKLECSSNPMRKMARCAATLDRASHKHGRSICQAPGGTSGRRWPTAMVEPAVFRTRCFCHVLRDLPLYVIAEPKQNSSNARPVQLETPERHAYGPVLLLHSRAELRQACLRL